MPEGVDFSAMNERSKNEHLKRDILPAIGKAKML